MHRPRWWRWWTGDMSSPWVRIKWWLTNRLLDKPSRCRARLCSWALGFDSLPATLEDSESNSSCKEEARTLGYCWCGRVGCKAKLQSIGAEVVEHDVWVDP